MVLVSNGHGKFHMIYTALAADRAGILENVLTGFYPTPPVRSFLEPLVALTNNSRLKRWLMREVSGLNPDKVLVCYGSELFYQLSNRFPQFGSNGHRKPKFDAISLRLYQREAMRHIEKSQAKIYHCRAGYGGATIDIARKKGMAVIVDHSIPHPCALVQLVNKRGTYQPTVVSLPAMWEIVLDDIQRADIVLVNSDYVARTLFDYSFDPSKVRVLYLGLDPQVETFLNDDTPKQKSSKDGDLRFLFVGGVNRRKGADVLLDVFEELNIEGWQLTIAGGIDMELAERVRELDNPRIQILGVVTRDEVVKLMQSHHVFVFPTLAEGSARVVWEAMAAGMAIITTPNCGSVVENGVHGYLIRPGDTQELDQAVKACLEGRTSVTELGENGRELVNGHYNSKVYQKKIVELYLNLMPA